VTISLRRASSADVAFLAALVSHPQVASHLAAVRPASDESLAAEIERSLAEPEAYGVFVVECAGESVGTVAFERVNKRSRIAHLGGLAVHPAARGRGCAQAAVDELVRLLLDDLGYHRVQLEVYGFNERAARLFERCGFTREGVRRQAYWRNDTWNDGILFGLVAEDRQR
jgi:RimJ/RimL family protein N-acetyltransferase